MRVQSDQIKSKPQGSCHNGIKNFQNSFTDTLSSKSAIEQLLKIPLHPESVATLPCEMQSAIYSKSDLTCDFQYILKPTIFHNAFRMWWLMHSQFTTEVACKRNNTGKSENQLISDKVMNMWKLEDYFSMDHPVNVKHQLVWQHLFINVHDSVSSPVCPSSRSPTKSALI